MPDAIFNEIARAVESGELPDDIAGGYDIREVGPPNGPGEVFEVEDPDWPYVHIYQIVRRVPGVSRCYWWRFEDAATGEIRWQKGMPDRFLCRLVDMRRSDG